MATNAAAVTGPTQGTTGPMLLAYAVSQKYMIRGIAMTGLKG